MGKWDQSNCNNNKPLHRPGCAAAADAELNTCTAALQDNGRGQWNAQDKVFKREHVCVQVCVYVCVCVYIPARLGTARISHRSSAGLPSGLEGGRG